MTKLTNHIVDGSATSTVQIDRADKKGPGGAPHRYDITGFDTVNNSFSDNGNGYISSFSRAPIIFQDGTVPEKGNNGVTMESLLAIVQDALTHFQEGPYPCDENAEALEGVTKALDALNDRTRNRMKRNVEGKHTK